MLWTLAMRVLHRLLALKRFLFSSKDYAPYTELTGDERKYTVAVSLLQRLCRAEQGKNFVFSPLSLGAAFATLTAGLRGDAKAELLKFVGAVDDSELQSMFSALLSKKGLPLKMTNKYLAAEGCEIRQEFESLLKEKYKSEIECVDFATDARRIEKDVNTWAAKETNNMKPQLLQEGTFNRRTIFVILNAIYFKGFWVEAFEPVPDLMNFRLRNWATKIRRNFVTRTSFKLKYAETEKLRLVKIPYKEAGFYMLVAIPKNEYDHIDEILANMQPTELIKAIKLRQSWGTVILSMPKFKIEYDFDSVQQLMKDLAVKKIFDEDAADFGDLFATQPKGIFVDTIIHKAVIEVDENGTEAAAASAICMGIPLCAFSWTPRPIEVVLNRPFLYLVMSEDDLVCFAGICAEP